MAARKQKARETGTAGHDHDAKAPRATTGLPPDPQDLGRPMTPDEKVDEASLESMDASDPPARPMSTGAPPRRKGPKQPNDDAVERRARELWEADGRPGGRDDDYWHRAESDVRSRHV
jgi:hypothetical protein